MATIKDVARMANVSMSTVSKYLNGGKVRQQNVSAIRNAIEALDYRVNLFARNLKTPRSRAIGVLLPDIAAPFFGNVFTALDQALRSKGYHTILSCYSSSHGLERDNLQYLINNGIDGLIYVPENLSAEEVTELTANYNVPIVQVDRVIQGLASDAVMVDNADAVYAATSALIEKGHRRIALISGPKSVFTARERQVGYLRALSDHGILCDDSLFLCLEHTFAAGYQGFELLMKNPQRPTAVVSANYDITIGLFTAVRDRGLRIPEDIDIFGFDCVRVCTMMKPPLPVVQQPEQLLGQVAAQYLLERLEGYTGEPRNTQLKCELT